MSPTQRATRLPLGRSKRRLSFERRIGIWLTILTLPAVILTFATTYTETTSLPIATTVTIAIAVTFALVSSAFFEQIIRPLQTLSNVVASLREEDFTFRARGGRRGDALGDLALEINALASSMQQQRSTAADAITLVERVLSTMQSPVFVFDDKQTLRLLNAAAEAAFSLPPPKLIGTSRLGPPPHHPLRHPRRRNLLPRHRLRHHTPMDDLPLTLPPERPASHPSSPVGCSGSATR